jgi:hypothetical protein
MEIALRRETAAAISIRPCAAHNTSTSTPAADEASTNDEASASQEDSLVETAQ